MAYQGQTAHQGHIDQSGPARVIIMGAAGRDFHNFNVFFRDNPNYEIVAFTATQIPDIAGRRYPPELAGPRYPQGIPIYPEEDLPRLAHELHAQRAVFAYSDVPHTYVMHKASLCMANGLDFWLLGPDATMLDSPKPVVAICAVRTGVGKSQTTRRVVELLRGRGKKVVVVRHPMPYGDLVKQAVQRYETFEDLDRYETTIEEREEYEPHLRNGVIVYAGVDYAEILRQAATEADVVLWDGGNNDLPFFRPNLHIVLVDPHRPGHETSYHPGETNLRMAGVVVINKVDTAKPEGVETVRQSTLKLNPNAMIIEAASPIFVDEPNAVRGKRVLVIEDGPTLTHGGMKYGAGVIAARKFGAAELLDPRPYAVGSIRDTYKKYDVGTLLPAMGYGRSQMTDLEATVNQTPAELVIIATPIDLRRVINIKHPAVRVSYELEEIGRPNLEDALETVFGPSDRTRATIAAGAGLTARQPAPYPTAPGRVPGPATRQPGPPQGRPMYGQTPQPAPGAGGPAYGHLAPDVGASVYGEPTPPVGGSLGREIHGSPGAGPYGRRQPGRRYGQPPLRTEADRPFQPGGGSGPHHP